MTPVLTILICQVEFKCVSNIVGNFTVLFVSQELQSISDSDYDSDDGITPPLRAFCVVPGMELGLTLFPGRPSGKLALVCFDFMPPVTGFQRKYIEREGK
jgi:hypothetical protein